MQIVDTHAHVDCDAFDPDRQAVLARAAAAGVAWIVDVGVDLASSYRAVALAAQEPFVWAAVGVHPHDAATWNAVAATELRHLAQAPRVLAIGETGLDYYRDRSPRPKQREAFVAQLGLACELGLPVIIHSRASENDTLAMLQDAHREARKALRGVMHCFSGSVDFAHKVLELGLHIGIAGPVTYPRATVLAEIVRQVPLERLLLETDCPYLAPQARRGMRNEPAYVCLVAERVAALRDMPLDEVGCVTSANARELFRPV